jgi:hypothetical protein
VQLRRNFLDRADAKEFDDFKHEYHVCPEALALSRVSLIATFVDDEADSI